jgi:alkylation response protein AidB-like acyl-CoA dehydrogenase
MTTVGISQLTTSHQSGRPALAAIPEGDGYRLQGFMPWVTAAGVCQHIVTGAVLPDGRQILAAIPAGLPGLTVDPPMQLMALQPSATCEVHCRNVPVEGRFLIRGPAEQVLSSRSTVKPFVVASAGVGLAAAMVRCMKSASKSAQDPLAELADELAARHEAIRDRLHRHASAGETPSRAAGGDGDSKTQIRIAVNDLLVRLAAAVLTLSKGSGLLRQREPQRLAREALFFLVWSAPEDVRAGTLASLLHRPPPSSASMDWI